MEVMVIVVEVVGPGADADGADGGGWNVWW